MYNPFLNSKKTPLLLQIINMKSISMLRNITTLALIVVLTIPMQAESATIDFLRSTGKIYSVVAGIVAIFIGLAFYLWRIDRKLTKLENHIKDE